MAPTIETLEPEAAAPPAAVAAPPPQRPLLKRAWTRWKQVAHRVGDVQARVILTALYLVPLAPFALVVRWLDPLQVGRRSTAGWRPRQPDNDDSLVRASRQF
jgi:hypothetical protein